MVRATSCIKGHAGVLCEDCVDENSYFDSAQAKCSTCSSTSTIATVVVGFVLGVTLAVAIGGLLFLRSPAVRGCVRRVVAIASALGLVAKSKLVRTSFPLIQQSLDIPIRVQPCLNALLMVDWRWG